MPVVDQQIAYVNANNIGAVQATDANFQTGPFVPTPLPRNDNSLGNSGKKKSTHKEMGEVGENSSRNMLPNNIPLYYDVDDLGKYAAFKLVPYPNHK